MFGIPIPMPVLAGLEAFAVTALYALIFIWAPSLALSRRLEGMRLCERFLIYIVFGNFCVINIVLLLELLHIAHTVTLAAAYIGLLVFLRWKLYGSSPLQFVREARVTVLKLAHRTLTWRQVLLKRTFHPLLWIKKKLMALLHELPSAILLVICMAGVVYVFGLNAMTNFGYVASDLPVHNYWINGLIDNKPFVAGIYPMGYHCVAYVISLLGGIPAFVILRMIGLVQTFYFMLTMIAFLRAVCRSRFVPYLGLLPFVMATNANYDRYLYGIPQEHGMIFILPALWCAFKFFEQFELERKGEADGSLPKMKFDEAPSTRWLAGFSAGVSLTIAVHFYDFFALAFFIVAGGICYAFRLVHLRFLWRVFAGGVAGLLMAALPMAIAFAMGTPLQGSIGWGLEQMSGTESTQTQSSSVSSVEASATSSSEQANDSQSVDTVAISSDSQQQVQKKPMTERLAELMKDTIRVCTERVARIWKNQGNLFGNSLGYWYLYVAIGMIVVALALRIFGQRDYGAQVATMGVALIVMGFVLASPGLPWPTLMDTLRTTSFMLYLVPACLAVGIDAVVSLVTLWAKKRLIRDFVSAAVLVALVCAAFMAFGLQTPGMVLGYEPNGNIICLERILREYSNFNWTIVSANDELRMSEKYGYHVEVNEFLSNMEHRFLWQGKDGKYSYKILPAKGDVIIPTEYVFFFIEKIPTEANLITAGNASKQAYSETFSYGDPISEAWADKSFPGLPTIDSYRGRNRFIEMSRMYFWAQEYMKRFPNEMEVFYEDDEMVCYRLHQPVADWFDLYIEYGYNDVTAKKMLDELKDSGSVKQYGMASDGQMRSYSFINAIRAGLGSYVHEGDERFNADAIQEGAVVDANLASTRDNRGGKQ